MTGRKKGRRWRDGSEGPGMRRPGGKDGGRWCPEKRSAGGSAG
ncbi:hypothetical protein TREPR_2090 [Treponema primitia ZAS-2]|uniref:Uncharacterized protein n=1 Tax=Treponema primitia (strain ATCC BAA-887 / DSM 12427 / ZAS-2) TaxID=545694 RepID=F5YJQ0_TREPZ|nr:hypothetical protein TREPR_2090 [Treponema primitia ZAS-2]